MKINCFTLLVLALLMGETTCPTQVLNIDKTDTTAYNSNAVFNLNLATGLEIDKQKITVYDASTALDLSLQKSKALIVFSSGYRFTYNGPDDLLNTGFVHLRYRQNYKNNLHPETYLQYQWDSQRGIEYRALGGANIRWNNYLHPRFNLVLATGLMYEQERWNYVAVPDSAAIPLDPKAVQTQYIKSNSYMKFEIKVSDNSDLFFTTFLQTRPDQFFIYPRIANVLKWDVNVTKRIGIEINFSSMYDTRPVVPIAKFYFSFSDTVTFKI